MNETLIFLENLDQVEYTEISSEQYVVIPSLLPQPTERACKVITHPYQLFHPILGIDNLDVTFYEEISLSPKISVLLSEGRLLQLNTHYLEKREKIKNLTTLLNRKIRIHILALGDVGGTLLLGLKLLLIHSSVEYIGIYDRSEERKKRYELEINQIYDVNHGKSPMVKSLEKEELFDCDLFVFCASAGVPPIDSDISDVRMIQLDKNAEILKPLIEEADQLDFDGLFCIVSDPVDQLCEKALSFSQNQKNNLLPDQIMGFGLGVMYARARYYASLDTQFSDFEKWGRAFGPHGKDLFIANSISDFDKEKSQSLTQKTVTANLSVRKLGFKPYIAPAISSGALSLSSLLEKNWIHACHYTDGVYFGCRSKFSIFPFIQWEALSLPKELRTTLEHILTTLRS